MPQEIQVFEDPQQTIEPKKSSPGIRPILRTLKRNVALIMGMAGITTLAALPFIGEAKPPIYKGNFQLLVEPVTSEQKLADPT
jgi:polysaccharide biosynthesis transport protein